MSASTDGIEPIYEGSTIWLRAYYTDVDGVAIDPDTDEVKVYDKDGDEMTAWGSPFSMSKEATGQYIVGIQVGTVTIDFGLYHAIVKFTKDAKTDREIYQFRVQRIIPL